MIESGKEVPQAEKPRPRPAAWCAALLTLLSVGSGHVYAGRVRRAAVWVLLGMLDAVLVVAILLYVPAEGVSLIALWAAVYLGFFAAAAIDAARCARRSGPIAVPTWKRALMILASVVLVSAAFAGETVLLATRLHVFRSPTYAMEPTILAGERFAADLFAYRPPFGREPARGDLVVYRFPSDRSRTFLKRIVGLPGDTLEGRDLHIYLNGDLYEEDDGGRNFGPVEVPASSYFVLGDNRHSSIDSRFPQHGLVPREDLLGRVVLIVWSNAEAQWSKDEQLGVRWNRLGLRPR